MGTSAADSAGSQRWCTMSAEPVSCRPSALPLVGNQPDFTPSRIMSTRPTEYCGAASDTTDSDRRHRRADGLPRRKAPIEPSSTATPTAAMAKAAHGEDERVLQSASTTIGAASCWRAIDQPRSPRTTTTEPRAVLDEQRLGRGRSGPPAPARLRLGRCSARAATTPGRPGRSFSVKNTTTETPNRIGITYMDRAAQHEPDHRQAPRPRAGVVGAWWNAIAVAAAVRVAELGHLAVAVQQVALAPHHRRPGGQAEQAPDHRVDAHGLGRDLAPHGSQTG